MTLRNVVRLVVEHALVFYKGNKTAAARSLGIAVRTLDKYIIEHQQEDEAVAARMEAARIKREEFRDRERAVPPSAQFATSATPTTHVTNPRFNPK